MGYETKLYIGEQYSRGTNEAAGYFRVAAMIDLSKCGHDAKINDQALRDGEPIYFYGTDGNHQITEDRYGDKLTAVPLEIALKALKSDSRSSKYRRFKWAVTLLKAMKDDNMKVVLFGH